MPVVITGKSPAVLEGTRRHHPAADHHVAHRMPARPTSPRSSASTSAASPRSTPACTCATSCCPRASRWCTSTPTSWSSRSAALRTRNEEEPEPLPRGGRGAGSRLRRGRERQVRRGTRLGVGRSAESSARGLTTIPAMLAASAAVFTCQPQYFFDDLCNTVQSHEPTPPLRSDHRARHRTGGHLYPGLRDRGVSCVASWHATVQRGRRRSAGSRPGPQHRRRRHVLLRGPGAAWSPPGYRWPCCSPSAELRQPGHRTRLPGRAPQRARRHLAARRKALQDQRPGSTIADVAGVVQTITLRTTALRTADGRLAMLPNLTVFSGVVINSSAYGMRRYTVSLRIERDRDLEAALRAAHGLSSRPPRRSPSSRPRRWGPAARRRGHPAPLPLLARLPHPRRRRRRRRRGPARSGSSLSGRRSPGDPGAGPAS